MLNGDTTNGRKVSAEGKRNLKQNEINYGKPKNSEKEAKGKSEALPS